MYSFRRLLNVSAHVVVAISLLAISGCGAGPRLYRVSGTLLHKGEPLPEMMVMFRPVDGSKPSSSMTDAEGKFTLMYTIDRQGAAAGEHVVEIDYVPANTDLLVAYQSKKFGKLPANVKAVVEKYDDPKTSPYRVTIDSNQSDLQVNLD